jgi:arylformamidase
VADGWIDVSVPISSGMVHWPGDPEVKITRASAISEGDDANVSHLDFGAHTGTHMDAPVHFLDGEAGIDTMPLDATIGPCRVLAIADGVSVKADELERHAPQRGERLLLKTRNSTDAWPRAPEFAEDFVYIAHDGAQLLADRGVRTVGVDYLSVGGFEHDAVETHVALLRAGVWIIEGLDLSAIEPGHYELCCLPLRIAGSDGAPARALLHPAQSKT